MTRGGRRADGFETFRGTAGELPFGTEPVEQHRTMITRQAGDALHWSWGRDASPEVVGCACAPDFRRNGAQAHPTHTLRSPAQRGEGS
jgi:hypothetical protein